MQLKMDKNFKRNLKRAFDKYELRVGILEDGPHYDPVHLNPYLPDVSLSQYAGGPVRKKSKTTSTRLEQVSSMIRLGQGVDYLREPFTKKSAALEAFLKQLFWLVTGKSSVKRVENALQAVVRNPILRGDYGSNAPRTVSRKGFNRFLFDTGQFFKAIKASVKTRGARV